MHISSFIAKGIVHKTCQHSFNTKSEPNQVKGSAKWQDQKSMPLRDQNCLLRPDPGPGVLCLKFKEKALEFCVFLSVDGTFLIVVWELLKDVYVETTSNKCKHEAVKWLPTVVAVSATPWFIVSRIGCPHVLLSSYISLRYTSQSPIKLSKNRGIYIGSAAPKRTSTL